MLELSRNDINFVYVDSQPLQTAIVFRNTSETQIVAFKIKTTTPQMFDVTPSKGLLSPKQSRPVSFRTHNPVRRQQLQNILQQKFLVQYMTLSQNKRSREIDQLWQLHRDNPQVIRNQRLRLTIDGVSAPISSVKDLTPSGNLYNSHNGYASVTPDVPMERMDDLNRQQERLLAERQAQFSRAAKPKKGKIISWLVRLLVLGAFIAIGYFLYNYINNWRKNRMVQETKTIVTGPVRVSTSYDEPIIITTNTQVHEQPKVQIVEDVPPPVETQIKVENVQVKDLTDHGHYQIAQNDDVVRVYVDKDGNRVISSYDSQNEGVKPSRKVILTAPEDAEVIVNRANNEPVRLTVLGAHNQRPMTIEY